MYIYNNNHFLVQLMDQQQLLLNLLVVFQEIQRTSDIHR